ncbi:hypothetical protein BXT84_07670 [Sulfobacillus thermotolerans]|uniref:FAD/NAD(P)-binding domain-containing protein n=1 Tax=Sulfobacillus thermotolerans TaxID=338644 RepID=A0ABN5H2I0_9FIRM|nr:hypothetical protein BXT84_07670 [Sulfobacillus thermotolerans]
MGRTEQAVILGSRFGGLAVSTWLRRLYRPGQLAIVVIDQWRDTVYRPGLVHAVNNPPNKVMSSVQIPLTAYRKRHAITFVHDVVTGIDPVRHLIHTANHPPVPYTVLFIATGSRPGWHTIKGLEPSCGGICEDYLARQLASTLTHQIPRRIVFAAGGIDSNPAWTPPITVGCECPLLEAAFLWDTHLRQQNQRGNSTITVLTPAKTVAENAGPKAQHWLQQELARRHIGVVTEAQYHQVTASEIILRTQRIRYDATVWIPPYIGSEYLRGTDLDDGFGWVPTNAYLNHPHYPEIYAVGDIVSHSWPKMGHSAMVQAHIAVKHWHAVQNHRPLPQPYRPQLLWALETGGGRGLFVQSDVYYGGSREIVHAGHWPWAAKSLFQKAYMVLRGNLPV